MSSHGREIFPAELVTVAYTRPEPIFSGRPGQWDARLRERSWVMREGDLWRMWYTGYDGADSRAIKRLGLAVSRDGISWQRFQDEPLIKDAWIEDPMVLSHDGRYMLVAEGRNDRAVLYESDDGIDWDSKGQLDVRRANGEPLDPGPYGTPTLFHHEDYWWLFYERNDTAVWLARSKDARRWVNVQDDPVIDPGTCGFDTGLIAMDQVIEREGLFYAFLHAKQGGDAEARVWAAYVAVSDDLVNWYKYARNPISPADGDYGSPVIVHDGHRYRMYTTDDAVHLHYLREPVVEPGPSPGLQSRR